jgi:hypothetical protein
MTTQPLSKNALMVKVLSEERPVRGQTLQEGEVHENRERDRGEGPRTGGPRTTETWFVSRHYDLRTDL